MNELKHEFIELLNKHNLTISEYDELINFMHSIKEKAILKFEYIDNHEFTIHSKISNRLYPEKTSITLL